MIEKEIPAFQFVASGHLTKHISLVMNLNYFDETNRNVCRTSNGNVNRTQERNSPSHCGTRAACKNAPGGRQNGPEAEEGNQNRENLRYIAAGS